LASLALDLAATGLALARATVDVDGVHDELTRLWAQGAALERLRAMVAAQGGDPGVCDDPDAVLPTAPTRLTVTATRAGYLAALPARAVGELSGTLGAGRARKTDDVDPAVGVELLVEVGDRLESGTPIAVVHARDDDDAARAAHDLAALIVTSDEPPALAPVLLGRVG
jgi:thymidine phosphorylase